MISIKIMVIWKNSITHFGKSIILINLTMKLAIIGSRTCPPVDIEQYLKYIPETIVSGGAKGADTYAREFAQKHNIKLIEFLPKYDKYGRAAPLVRNILIIEECDCVLAFWDGKSRGTMYTIDWAKKNGKACKDCKLHFQ